MQTKLLRVLETSEFLKVGDSKPVKVNVRIIAATNRELSKEVEAGRFRSDLYYRLAVFQIELPPLRERKEDIELFVNHFLDHYSIKMNKKRPSVSKEFIDKMKSFQWKGNVRELKNTIERILILTNNPELTINDLPLEIQNSSISNSIQSAFDLSLVEKQHIQKVLKYTHGNKTETARLLNIGLTTLYRKIQDYKLE
jgi:two-component system NtrC family response regulator